MRACGANAGTTNIANSQSLSETRLNSPRPRRLSFADKYMAEGSFGGRVEQFEPQPLGQLLQDRWAGS
jgi:hypothetical protein